MHIAAAINPFPRPFSHPFPTIILHLSLPHPQCPPTSLLVWSVHATPHLASTAASQHRTRQPSQPWPFPVIPMTLHRSQKDSPHPPTQLQRHPNHPRPHRRTHRTHRTPTPPPALPQPSATASLPWRKEKASSQLPPTPAAPPTPPPHHRTHATHPHPPAPPPLPHPPPSPPPPPSLCSPLTPQLPPWPCFPTSPPLAPPPPPPHYARPFAWIVCWLPCCHGTRDGCRTPRLFLAIATLPTAPLCRPECQTLAPTPFPMLTLSCLCYWRSLGRGWRRR